MQGDDPVVDILLVDDREPDLRTLESLLASPGHRLVTARSGVEALRQILRYDFAVILLDVLMPGMDGFEVAAHIKTHARFRHTPILFLTAEGHADVSAIYRAYSVGAVDYLTKPIDGDVLRAKVGIFVELHRKDRRIREQAQALLEADRRARTLELDNLRMESERRYRNLAEAVPLMVWTTGPDGAVQHCNRRWREYGGAALRYEGWSWLEHVHPDDRERHEAGLRRAFATGELYEGEIRLGRKDGAYRWHLARVVCERGPAGEVAGFIGTYTDCDDLRRALEARDEFLLVASHELRTPLSALKLKVQGLQRSLRRPGVAPPNGDLAGMLDGAVRQANRLHRLIESLLEVSRITAGRVHLELEELDLVRLVREVVERFADEAERVGVALSLEAEVEATGCWDRSRIDQVVTNLLSNALKFASGKPVVVRVDAPGEKVRLSVQDHGSGVTEADRARIFERFERAADGASHQGGLGIGLYVTRQIVLAHGGAIELASQVGVGSTFTVELPRRATAEKG
jgi:PAS domain S-box-containing protein